MVNSDVQQISKYALGIDTAQQVKEPMLFYDVSPNDQIDIDTIEGSLNDATSSDVITTPTDKVFRIYGCQVAFNCTAASPSTIMRVTYVKNSQTRTLVLMKKTTLTAVSNSHQILQLRNPIIPDRGTKIQITSDSATSTISININLFYKVSER